MKRKSVQGSLVVIMFFIMGGVKAQLKNYLRVETGHVVIGSGHKLKNQMKQDGLGDFDSFQFSLGEVGGQYPKKRGNGGKVFIRYGRQLKKQRFLE